jgi:sugar lactone lactonase YvrE
MTQNAEIELNVGDLVGESILWCHEERSLYWIDICGRRIHRYEPDGARHDTWETPDFPTSIAMRKSGGFLVSLQHQICFWQPDGRFETFVEPEPDMPRNRLNEGRVAPDGSFWVASMQNNLNSDGSSRPMTASTGAVYRIDSSGNIKKLTENIFGISNTMAWSDEGDFYFADTMANAIYRFDYDAVSSTLGKQEIFVSDIGQGAPDGSTLDSYGRIWNCRFGGGSVLCFDRNGSVCETLRLPVTSPTSCTFGGKDLSTLYITSAQFGLSHAEVVSNPIEGCLLSAKVGVVGNPEPKFG